MGITLKNLVILLVVVGVGVWVYMNYGPKIDPNSLKPDEYQKAESLFTLGKFDTAVPALQAAIKSNPDDARAQQALFWIAKAIDQDQRPDRAAQQSEALHAYKAYLAQYPSGEYKSEAKKHIDLLEAQGAK